LKHKVFRTRLAQGSNFQDSTQGQITAAERAANSTQLQDPRSVVARQQQLAAALLKAEKEAAQDNTTDTSGTEETSDPQKRDHALQQASTPTAIHLKDATGAVSPSPSFSSSSPSATALPTPTNRSPSSSGGTTGTADTIEEARLSAKLHQSGENSRISRQQKYFCSNLVAVALVKIGVLPDVTLSEASCYLPKAFEPGGEIDDNLQSTYSLGAPLLCYATR